jgi:hypothetical protein
VSYLEAIVQNVRNSAGNCSVANLDAGNGYAFTGTIDSTLGVADIQVTLFADQDCTIYIDQSTDATPHWDLVDHFQYFRNRTDFGLDVKAISSYFRVRVVSTYGLATTVFRLQCNLCPISQPSPRSLNSLGYARSGTFGNDIAQGDVNYAAPLTIVGYTPTMTTTESDVWPGAGVYVYPTAEMQMEILSANNTNDRGTVIKGNAEGANQTILCDAGGTKTTLNDADVDFLAATAVAVGDCLLIDPKGTNPEWGFVTAVATHTLTFALGLSNGGSCATARAYTVVDKSAYTGAQAVQIRFLDANYVDRMILMVLNGTTVVTTKNSAGSNLTNLFRINVFQLIAAGSLSVPAGNVTLRGVGGGATYSYFLAGYTRSRSSIYTVPAQTNLYITSISYGWGHTSNSTQYCRLYLRANLERETGIFNEGFNTGSIFYPYAEVIMSNASSELAPMVPLRMSQKTDIKMSGIATYSGVASVTLRGYLVGGLVNPVSY